MPGRKPGHFGKEEGGLKNQFDWRRRKAGISS
jgi:hypothetical protein